MYWARSQVAPSLHPAPAPPRPPGHGDGDAGMTVDSSYNGEIIILIYNVKLGITDSGYFE